MQIELGKSYTAMLEDGTLLKFKFEGGVNCDISLERGNSIPILKLPRFTRITETDNN